MNVWPEHIAKSRLRDGWWSGRDWSTRIQEHAASRPTQTALVDPPNKQNLLKSSPRQLTWGEVPGEVRAVELVLRAGGVQPGTVVIVALPNTIEFALSVLAIAQIGAVASPVPIQYRAHELRAILAQIDRPAIVTSSTLLGFDQVAMFMAVDPCTVTAAFDWREGTLEPVLAFSSSTAQDCVPRREQDDPAATSNRCATINWTSGTTGPPKGVLRCFGDWDALGTATLETPRLAPRDVIMNPFPVASAGSVAGTFIPWLLAGATLVQHHPFDIEIFCEQVAEHRVTYTCAPPAILDRLVTSGRFFDRFDLASLRVIGSGSAPLNGWMIDRWEREHGVEVVNLFGSTEGLTLFADRDSVPDPEKRGRILPMPGHPSIAWRSRLMAETEGRLVDPQSGESITKRGAVGELRVRGPGVCNGYLGDRPSPFDEHGFACTGEMFRIEDDDGAFLLHVDRLSDMIIRGGFNISGPEIESVLLKNSKISEIAVVGAPDNALNERVAAFVVPAPGVEDGLSIGEISDYLHDAGVARFKHPEVVHLVDSLPRNPTGKVKKNELRAALGKLGQSTTFARHLNSDTQIGQS